MESIRKEDLQPLLNSHTGNRVFAEVLRQATTSDALLTVLARYIHFNATFGACVANLAGEIAVRQDLFRDPEEPMTLLADRSADVGSDIFFAAVDEFDDRATPHRDTHRSLAQSTLKATAQFFQYSAEQCNALFALNTATEEAIRASQHGYGVNQVLTEEDILRSIGFHAGSEVLADEEFRILDGTLRGNFPELVAFLEKTQIAINGENHAAYFWIHIHTSVEADHFAFALQGANRALRYYVGEKSEAKQQILAGIEDFAQVQAAFMEGLGDGVAL